MEFNSGFKGLNTVCHEYLDEETSGFKNGHIKTDFVCFLLGNSPTSEFYMPTFRNTLSVPYS